uniref:Uncharacterized protein n=1 Tax=Chromera velia CCMP2878 TaxID=1169474 RepID=A0A0G4H436_9ALVE|eukprot:Cvel_24578.t1-p1 / transcript=Cvel_24578.t1 / gene=Cvel_24578 / organism=Chromera_velia_CCMP2878 / gene_product=Ankyrin-3, putative / transcript_product=Ankyrin-3, putative / location=Cvel_scaffold2675:5973-7370(-) / protein_length=466 / sequence_SO=supercontig / SO=protein_coding / is_pseudo=false
MQRTAATLVPVREGLRGIADGLLEVVGMVQSMDALLGSVKFPDHPTGEPPSSEPVPDISSSALLPAEAASLGRLTRMVENVRKGVRVELNRLMSLYYRIDLGPLFTRDIGEEIRSFQVVTAEVLREALNAFMETGKKEKRDDLELLLTVGAEVDSVVEVPQAGAVGGAGGGGQQTLQETALMRAVDFGSLEAVKMLVGAGAGLEVRREDGGREGGKRALHIACREGKPEIAQFLVESGAELEAATDIGGTPLHYAAQAGLTDLVRFLLRRGVNVHAKSDDSFGKRTPIFNAVGNGHKEVVQLLLHHGAKVNGKDEKQRSPLFFTATLFDHVPRDHADIAKLLISRGTDVDARDKRGATTLHVASLHGSLSVMKVWLNNGADVHATTNGGNTALHCVAERKGQESEERERSLYKKKLRVAKLLVSKGIDVNAVNQQGRTALQIAEARQPADSPLLAYLRGLNLAPSQ